MNIRELKPGREMDRLVAKHVFRWDSFWESPDGLWLMGLPPKFGIEDDRIPVPPYSTDISAAWQIVEFLRKKWTQATEGVDGFTDFTPPFDDNVFFEHLHRYADRRWPWAFLYVTPYAICRAALDTFVPEDDQDREE